jgi:hypothetical protein
MNYRLVTEYSEFVFFCILTYIRYKWKNANDDGDNVADPRCLHKITARKDFACTFLLVASCHALNGTLAWTGRRCFFAMLEYNKRSLAKMHASSHFTALSDGISIQTK